MRKLAMVVLGGALLAGGAGGALADPAASAKGNAAAKHESVKLADLPASARAALEREAQGGKIEELRKETNNGMVSYEAEIVKDGKGTDVAVSDKGMVLERGNAHNEGREVEEHDK
jgi:hypothetical protein